MKKFTLFSAVTLVAAMSVSAAPIGQRTHLPGTGRSLEAEMTAAPYVAGSQLTELPPVTGGNIDGIRILPAAGTQFALPQSALSRQNARALRSATAGSRVIADNVDLRGQVIASTNYKLYDYPAFYVMPHTADGVFTMQGSLNTYGINYGGFFNPDDNTYTGVYLRISSYDGSISQGYRVKINCETGATETTQFPARDWHLAAYAAAYDPTSGQVYGYYGVTGSCPTSWAIGDYDNFSTNIIKEDKEGYMRYVACTSTGQFYGLDQQMQLCKIDKTTGEHEVIAQTSVPYEMYKYSGCCINDKNQTMLVSSYTSDDQALYEVSLADGSTTKLYDYPESLQVRNMYIFTGVADKAPAAPQLSVTAPEGSMTPHYVVTLPDVLNDGTPASGLFHWCLRANGNVIAEGNNQPGTVIDGDVTFDTPGKVTFSVAADNEGGKSATAKVTIFVGNGIPTDPASVKAAWTDGKMSLSWDAVTASADGGYIDPAQVTYTVTDSLGMTVEGITTNAYEFDLAVPEVRTNYKYYVIASFAGISSKAIASNVVSLGDFDAPFVVDFKQKDVLTDYGFSVLDANADGKTWSETWSGVKCSYNSKKEADDWLFVPNVKLIKGLVYPVTIRLYASMSSYPEKVEVKYGKGMTVEAMTTELVAATEIRGSSSAPVELKALIAPEEDGAINIGIHCISAKDMGGLIAHSMEIGAGLDPKAPQAPTELTVTPEETGLHQATISVKAPSMTVVDTPIEGDVTIRIARDGEEVGTVTAAPGAVVTYTDDTVPVLGDYTWTVSSYCGEAGGLSVFASAFVGPYAPETPANARVIEQYQPGTVTVSWDAVTSDMKKNTLKAENVTYMVYAPDESGYFTVPVLSEATHDTSVTFDALEDPTQQEFAQFAVVAFNREVEGKAVSTNSLTIGKPYAMPMTITRPESLEDYVLGVGSGFAKLSFFGTESFEDGFPGVDDDYFLGIYSYYGRSSAELLTGKVSLIDAVNPEFSFYMYKLTDDDDSHIDISVISNGVTTPVASFSNTDNMTGQWNQKRLSLEQYKGKNIQLVIKLCTEKMAYAFIDNFSVRESRKHDIGVVGFNLPTVVNAAQNYNINVDISNFGLETADNFKVDLYRDGDVLESREIETLPSDGTIRVIFEDAISLFDYNSDEAVYWVELALEGDEDDTNDVSADVVVARRISKLPGVDDLSGEITEQGNQLTWTSKVGEVTAPYELTEDFESAEAWSHEMEGWEFVDVDQSPVGGITGQPIPGITVNETLSSFFVWDSAHENFINDDHCQSFSGHQCLASLFLMNRKAVDDWIISPELCGDAQTISFWAHAYDARYKELIEVWYTTEDSADPADFVKDETFGSQEVNGLWTLFSADLPEGTKHFAIRSNQTYAFICMIDDITFTPAGSYRPLDLKGYDVYRDGVKLNEQPVTEGSYLDTDVPVGKHTYHVVAVYGEGNSELSDPVKLETSSLTGVEAARVKVTGLHGAIRVSAPADATVNVYSTDGREIYKGVGSGLIHTSAAIYLVKVNGAVYKTIVK